MKTWILTSLFAGVCAVGGILLSCTHVEANESSMADSTIQSKVVSQSESNGTDESLAQKNTRASELLNSSPFNRLTKSQN